MNSKKPQAQEPTVKDLIAAIKRNPLLSVSMSDKDMEKAIEEWLADDPQEKPK